MLNRARNIRIKTKLRIIKVLNGKLASSSYQELLHIVEPRNLKFKVPPDRA